MANAIYPKWKEAVLNGGTGVALSGTLKVTLVDLADYTYGATHDFIDDVPAAARVATATLGTKTYTNGLLDAADTTFTTVTGDVSEALILWLDTGVESTSRLFAYFDTGVTGLPVTPNGGNINITWNASGIVQI